MMENNRGKSPNRFWNKSLEGLEEGLGYSFRDISLLHNALTHSSYANEHKKAAISDYERLEFLGDAVLELVTSQKLYGDYPEKSEGELTKLRASLVCEQALAPVSQSLGIPDLLYLGHGEDISGGRKKPSILCDTVESVIGAIYLDGGIEAARLFIEERVLPKEDFSQNKNSLSKDAKTTLQERLQAKSRETPSYKTVEEHGPDHNRTYLVEVYSGGELLGRGQGRSKKEAQQAAAGDALEKGV